MESQCLIMEITRPYHGLHSEPWTSYTTTEPDHGTQSYRQQLAESRTTKSRTNFPRACSTGPMVQRRGNWSLQAMVQWKGNWSLQAMVQLKGKRYEGKNSFYLKIHVVFPADFHSELGWNYHQPKQKPVFRDGTDPVRA
jgi:hypothetical protein